MRNLALHQTRLSTGKRINSAQDDPAGLTIATKMLARSEGLKISLDNISDAKNMLSVAEGGLSKMTDIIVQMRSKAEQAASDTIGTSERGAIQDQLSAYAQQIQDLVDQTKWNGVKLLDNTTGNKVFQTGVDEGETTTWTLPSKLDPASLNLSEIVSADTATFVDVSNSFSGGTTAARLAACRNSQPVIIPLKSWIRLLLPPRARPCWIPPAACSPASTPWALQTPRLDELASGRYNVKITSVAGASDVSYIITNLDDSTWNTTGSMTVSNEDISAGNVLDDAGDHNRYCADLWYGSYGLVAGQSMNFEYIAQNEAKFELNDASGQAVQIARNAAGSTSGSYSYTAAAGTFQTGRGVSITMGAFANFAAGETERFTYQQANNFSVDVSTAIKAGAYMTTANYALDKVTSALSGLGSLMARLSFKEEAISTAQVNVEGCLQPHYERQYGRRAGECQQVHDLAANGHSHVSPGKSGSAEPSGSLPISCSGTTTYIGTLRGGAQVPPRYSSQVISICRITR